MNWLRLIRWNNLLLIIITQGLVWLCVISPMEKWGGVALFLTPLHFVLLCLSTVTIAAAGYVINDYFDFKIDAINRPHKMVLNTSIRRRTAIIYHSILNIVGLALAGVLARKANQPQWLVIQVVSTLLLFFYSSHFKRWYVVGNVIVAVLTGLSVLTLFIYEPALRIFVTAPSMITLPRHQIANPVWVLGIYTWFAFVLTWMREIVKDMEDHIGDAAEGCVTMPIKIGLKKSVAFTQAISLLALIPLIIASWQVQGILGAYVFIALTVPISLWVWYLPRKATVQHYALMSKLLKWIMVLGVGSLLIYFFQANGTLNSSLSIAP